MPFCRSICLTFAFILFGATSLQAQMPIVDDEPIEPNLRLGWKLDADGGVNGDEWNGFEVAYGDKLYPLDQMVVSYAHANRDNNASHDVMLSIEEYYPLSDRIVPYGIAGLGYRWTDLAANETGDSTGWFGKIGFGLKVDVCSSFAVFGELSYHVSDRDLWQDDDEADSQNVVALLGIRYSY